MDSRPQKVYLIEHHTCKYAQILRIQFKFQPIFTPTSWFWPILRFPLSPNHRPHTESEYAVALCASQTERILGCHNDTQMALSHILS